MRDQTDTKRRLPFLTQVPARDRKAIEAALMQDEERQRRADESRLQKARAMHDRLERDVHACLGAAKLQELRQAIQREVVTLRELGQPPSGVGRDHARDARAARRRIDALARKLGADSGKLKGRLAEYDRRLLHILSSSADRLTQGYHLEGNLDKWIKLSPLHERPLPWGALPPDDPDDPYRWFVFRPPFFGFLFNFWHVADDSFLVDRELVLDPPAGLVGNKITIDCDDGGFGDLCQARADAQIAFAFEPPTTGLMEILVDVQNVQGTYDLRITDNFWFSSALAVQNNYIMMSLLFPNASETQLAPMDSSNADTDGDDVSLFNNHLNRIQHYFAQFFSSAPVRAGELVYVTIGTRSMEIAAANNMNLHSASDFEWFVSSVEVRIVP